MATGRNFGWGVGNLSAIKRSGTSFIADSSQPTPGQRQKCERRVMEVGLKAPTLGANAMSLGTGRFRSPRGMKGTALTLFDSVLENKVQVARYVS